MAFSSFPSAASGFRRAIAFCCHDHPSQAKAVLALEDEYGISARERDVLECLAEGLTAVPIAEKLYISVATAKSHIYSIYKKLGVHSQNEVIAMCQGR